MKKTLFLLFIILLSFPYPSQGKTLIPVTIQQDTLDSYNELLLHTGKHPYLLEELPTSKISRSLADVIIAQKAIKLGGIEPVFIFKAIPNSRRATEDAANGLVVFYPHQLNLNTLNVPRYKKNFLVSDPITRFGEFQKAFYCLASNAALLSCTNAKEINLNGKGIVGQHWHNDKKVLRDMGITNLIDAPTFECMIKMIRAGRADWIPLEISNAKDSSMTLYGVHLVPIPEIKFSLLESRHFFISKTHPEGEKIYEALQKGIKELRKQGFIHKILTQAGMFNPNADSWTILNAEKMKAGMN
ncbi:ABC transporter substrate-binding protein [Maridesulfovibrio salexigens]|uniref:Solute-binding protein family 3/N-terminal domain-containing protein n=1 Tax=Maridesulfovibrio salexigens (strain ATCC 14822 / DSM 2638 / NCIMB 8403 / VKM B-1763) TaxID=526222 RepID=C6BZ66_MARSD|nr:ABC transporter substrate-binding protein [Maridesulfovibrio salexigens]ACS78890.1 hypothetical protein Desal_0824 [Maridesulfovibrio salexigens DSM 2638]